MSSSKLLEKEHVSIGAFLWCEEGGSTMSSHTWDAIIVNVDWVKGVFYIRRLDNMIDDPEAYPIDRTKTSSERRYSMHLEENMEYIAKKLKERSIGWDAGFASAEQAFASAKREFERRQRALKELPQEVQHLLAKSA